MPHAVIYVLYSSSLIAYWARSSDFGFSHKSFLLRRKNCYLVIAKNLALVPPVTIAYVILPEYKKEQMEKNLRTETVSYLIFVFQVSTIRECAQPVWYFGFLWMILRVMFNHL